MKQRLVPALMLMAALVSDLSTVQAKPPGGSPGLPVNWFEPAATFEVSGSVAEIVAATPDGQLLVYTDSEEQEVGFVDITDPAQPKQPGVLKVDGEPTAVAITPDGAYVLVTVKGDPSYLWVFNLLAPLQPPVELLLDGEPDSVTVSPDGRYAAIAIENERENVMPDLPGGFLTIVDLIGVPSQWGFRTVLLEGVSDRFPTDPEPEFVAINEANIVALTLQENNWIVTIDLATGQLLSSFSAGTTSHSADLTTSRLISFADELLNARREPDAIAWTPQGNLVTANEGDYDEDLGPGEFVGGRNFTIFSPLADIVFDSGAELERLVAAAGFYNDGRSNDKGVEPEGIAISRYLNHTFLFVGMERARPGAVAVYRLTGNESSPKFVQILQTGARPEGLLPIPSRGLFVTANEGDGTLSIFVGRP